MLYLTCLLLPLNISESLREKRPYSEFFWPVFSRIRTGYEDLLSKSPYSIQVWEITDQKNSEYGHFLSQHITLFQIMPVTSLLIYQNLAAFSRKVCLQID